MSGSLKLDNVVGSLINTAPPGELIGVKKALSTIVSDRSANATIDNALEAYIKENGAIISSQFIASEYNKDKGSTKFIDYINKKAFNIDFKSQKAIDFEDIEPDVEYPKYFDELVSQLEDYGQDHYPSTFAFTVVPGVGLHVIVIGQRINLENFYTGQWKSHYLIENGSITGAVHLDIHYYEDGNVRLNFEESVSGKLSKTGASEIVNFINTSENKITLKIVENFNELNQRSFKSLRRLLPITRSKINWGKAIGNYRLGSDVVQNK